MSHPDKGMVAGQDSPPGGMSYAAHRKGGLSACARERESLVAFFREDPTGR